MCENEIVVGLPEDIFGIRVISDDVIQEGDRLVEIAVEPERADLLPLVVYRVIHLLLGMGWKRKAGEESRAQEGRKHTNAYPTVGQPVGSGSPKQWLASFCDVRAKRDVER